MTKRNLFAELTEGFDALACARKGKKTLRTTEVELKPSVEVSADGTRNPRKAQPITSCVCQLPQNQYTHP